MPGLNDYETSGYCQLRTAAAVHVMRAVSLMLVPLLAACCPADPWTTRW